MLQGLSHVSGQGVAASYCTCLPENGVLTGQHAPRRSLMVAGDDCHPAETYNITAETAWHSAEPTQQRLAHAQVRFY